MYEIVPQRLYLSNYQDAIAAAAADDSLFVINCTKDLPTVKTKYGTRLYVDDSPASVDTMTENLPLMVKYIEDAPPSTKVLVHCFAGQQRSAIVVAAYLMKTMGLSAQEAIDYVKSKKPDAFAGGVHFMESLVKYDPRV